MIWPFTARPKFDASNYIIKTSDEMDTLEVRRTALIYDFWDIRRNCMFHAKLNYRMSLVLLFFSVGSSSVSGVLSLLKFDPTVTGLIAFGPTIVALFAAAFRFQDKANWFYRRKDVIDSLYGKFSFEGPAPTASNTAQALAHVDAISREWREMNQKMSREWEEAFKVDFLQRSPN